MLIKGACTTSLDLLGGGYYCRSLDLLKGGGGSRSLDYSSHIYPSFLRATRICFWDRQSSTGLTWGVTRLDWLSAFRVPGNIGVSSDWSTSLGLPIGRTIVFWGLYWGPRIWGDDHVFEDVSYCHE